MITPYKIISLYHMKSNNTNKQYITLSSIPYNNNFGNFISIIILGYFSCKIAFHFIGIDHPKEMKYEMGDFISTLVLAIVLYAMLNIEHRHLLYSNGQLNIVFIGAFTLGLFGPLFQKSLQPLFNISTINYIFAIIFIMHVISMIFVGFRSAGSNVLSYGLYVITICIVLVGLLFSKQDEDVERHKQETHIIFSLGVSSWILALLLVYDAEGAIGRFIDFTLGLLIGLFVSGFSYEGASYFLSDSPPNKSDSSKKCDSTTIADSSNISNQLNTLKWIVLFMLLLLISLIITIYFVSIK